MDKDLISTFYIMSTVDDTWSTMSLFTLMFAEIIAAIGFFATNRYCAFPTAASISVTRYRYAIGVVLAILIVISFIMIVLALTNTVSLQTAVATQQIFFYIGLAAVIATAVLYFVAVRGAAVVAAVEAPPAALAVTGPGVAVAPQTVLVQPAGPPAAVVTTTAPVVAARV